MRSHESWRSRQHFRAVRRAVRRTVWNPCVCMYEDEAPHQALHAPHQVKLDTRPCAAPVFDDGREDDPGAC